MRGFPLLLRLDGARSTRLLAIQSNAHTSTACLTRAPSPEPEGRQGARVLDKIADPSPVNVCQFEPQPGLQKVVPIEIERLGGTRHQSAVRFVAAHHDCVAIIASQDRRLSLAGWNGQSESVFVLRNVQWWT